MPAQESVPPTIRVNGSTRSSAGSSSSLRSGRDAGGGAVDSSSTRSVHSAHSHASSPARLARERRRAMSGSSGVERQRTTSRNGHGNGKAVAFVDGGGEKRAGRRRAHKVWERVVTHEWISWIPPRWSWRSWQPVIRCAVAAWIGLVVQLIHPSELALGNAAFFVLVVAFMIPPYQSLIQALEIFLNLFFFCGLGWAWVCLGVFCADKTRVPTSAAVIAAAEAKWAAYASSPTIYQVKIIYDGTYLQAKPAVICALFLAVGTGALLWWKLRTAPSPATFPLVLSCILIDVSLSIVPLYPTAFYTSGELFFKPMAVQAGIATVVAFLVFPKSVADSFQHGLAGVLAPIEDALGDISDLFAAASKMSTFGVDDGGHLAAPDDDDVEFNGKLSRWADRSEAIRTKLYSSLAGITPLRALERYLAVDVSYGRLSGKDVRDLFALLALVQVRAGGMAFFFDVVIANTRHSHLDSSAFSVRDTHAAASRPVSRATSRAPSVRGPDDTPRQSISIDDAHDTGLPPAPTAEDHSHHESYFHHRFHLPTILHRRSGSPAGLPRSKASHISLLDHLRRSQQPVGVYESQRYMDVERAISSDTEHMLEQLELLASGSRPLVDALRAAVRASTSWCVLVDKKRAVREPHGARLAEQTAALQGALDDFRGARLDVIRPYKHLFDPTHPPPDDEALQKVKHRGLFCCFVAQYHLIEFAEALLAYMRKMEELDRARQKKQLWYPRVSSLVKHFSKAHAKEDATARDDGDPNYGDLDDGAALGEAKCRDPDHVPFDTPAYNAFSKLEILPDLLWSRSAMYAVKAGAIGVLTSLPAYFKSSTSFYYYNRGIWCTIMLISALAVFAGDTTTAWIARLFASFWGCLFGMVVWYIGSGSGQGNPYGLGAICAVTFPFAMFFRVHYPGAILTSVMSTSYLNGTEVQLTNASWGWGVAWRRFICVVIGITAAWIFAFIPPRFSAKRAVRDSYSRTIASAGAILCAVLSNAHDPRVHVDTAHELDTRAQLLAARTKLAKLGVRHDNVRHEYSFRGRWPEERYTALLATLQDTLSLLAQLNHVLGQLERPWRKALLERTRLADPLFLGDILAVVSMTSTALKAGTALPQITPAPLVARFRMNSSKGLGLPHAYDPAADAHGELPSLVTADVLESDDYMRYALAVTTTFSLISRLDGIVVICKTLLGENYHISHLHLLNSQV
ncbi:hypothetical protein Q5752_005756 [Cryptotrichosporon argae]